MISIFRKEITAFFSSLIGYIVIGIFLLFIGSFTWVFPDTSILEYNYAGLDPLFSFAPVVFLFLIPSVTMRSFSEEFQYGTFEFLATKPISLEKIIGAKYLANLALVLLALIPTLIYYYSVYQLGSPKGNLDSGGILGSYIGLVFLAASFVAIGLFASSLTKNQIIAFIAGIFLCFVMYWLFALIAGLPSFAGTLDEVIDKIGMSYHYRSVSRGLLELKDLVYFISVIFLFIYLTYVSLKIRTR